jgi:hypothetical protein
VAVSALALAVAVTAVWQGAAAVVDRLDEARDARREPRSVREEAPAFALRFPREVLRGARAAIPADARYAVVVGDSLPPSTVREAVRPMLGSFLLPRRQVGDLAAAEWVIAYGAPTASLGVAVRAEVELAPGVIVAKVER